MDWPCNATELCMFIGYINYYCTCRRVAHISLNQIDPQFINLLHRQTNAESICTMRLLMTTRAKLFLTIINGSAYTPMPLTFSQARVSSKKEGRLPTSLAIWRCHSKAILHWNSKYFPSHLLLKNFEVCSSKDIHVFMGHKNLMFNTLKTQYVLR